MDGWMDERVVDRWLDRRTDSRRQTPIASIANNNGIGSTTTFCQLTNWYANNGLADVQMKNDMFGVITLVENSKVIMLKHK